MHLCVCGGCAWNQIFSYSIRAAAKIEIRVLKQIQTFIADGQEWVDELTVKYGMFTIVPTFIGYVSRC